MLSRGGFANPDVLLVHTAGADVVVKDFRPRSWWVRITVGRWLNRREMRAYGRLDGVEVVPRLLARLDALAFAVEYRPGEMLSRSLRGHLPHRFMQDLEAGVRAMHARGVIHLDLRHRSNVLAGSDGRPVIIDFASAICVRPDRPIGRLMIRTLGALDLRALDKWRARIEPDTARPTNRSWALRSRRRDPEA